jgi:hypothetical protein
VKSQKYERGEPSKVYIYILLHGDNSWNVALRKMKFGTLKDHGNIYKFRIVHQWWWRQYAPLKRRSTIILHGSTSQKTILNIILAAVRTWNLTYISSLFCFPKLLNVVMVRYFEVMLGQKVNCSVWNWYEFCAVSWAVPLHATEALGGRRGIAPTHSRPRH